MRNIITYIIYHPFTSLYCKPILQKTKTPEPTKHPNENQQPTTHLTPGLLELGLQIPEMQNFSPKSEWATSYPVQIKYRKNKLIFYNIKQ